MDRIKFKINGVEHTVGCEVSSDLTLVDYIRNAVGLKGTKYMCREGGCGACLVQAVKCPGAEPTAVNSCLVSVTSCQDWEITTVEKVGNRLDGYHTVQKTLAEHHGTQCGYCTPGWIMAMYSLLQSKKDLTMLDIEQSFGSNICRCTGYRPILEAFKKFAKDAPKSDRILDIEDLHICKNTGRACGKNNDCEDNEWCIVTKDDVKKGNIKEIALKDGKEWYRVQEIRDIFEVLNVRGYDSYMLVAGNTAKGAYPLFEYPRVLIDISGVAQLKGCYVDQNLVIGAGTTLTEALDIFKTIAQQDYFDYLLKFYDHIRLVAHIPVRNIGTIGGNLMIKHQHNDFPSDLFLLFETVGAQLTILSSRGLPVAVTMRQFLRTDMRGQVILNVMLPPFNSDYKIATFKIMPRSQNVHAFVNAGFLYKLHKLDNRVLEARIVYGGLSPNFIRASITEALLLGKKLFTNETLQAAIKVLERELVVTENPPEPSAAYRKQLALGLFYKGLLILCPPATIGARYRSGAVKLHETRPVSDARQIFDTNPSLWPLNQPIQKVESLIQCSGEAQYSEDLPTFPQEVFADFVLSTVPTGEIANISPNNALKLPGVIAFYSAKDIPGSNAFTPAGLAMNMAEEELLCNGTVKFFNQPIGIIVAESRPIAERAAKLVQIQYKNVKKPVLLIKDAIKDPKRSTLVTTLPGKERGNDVTKVIKSENSLYGQFHFTMETHVCVTRPSEEGLDVHAATQWMDGVHIMVARALKMDENRIDVHVRRLGGGYGHKISRASQIAVACSLVSFKLNRPCRFILPMTANTKALGKRLPCVSNFEVGVNSTGVIQYMTQNLYEDNGYMVNEVLIQFTVDSFYNCYDNKRWTYSCYNVITDNAKNTWCRSPGTLEAIAFAETIMERISYELSLDPLEVRLANVSSTHNEIVGMVDTLKTNSQYTERRAAVDNFNKENRWKKRGLRFSLLRWTPLGYQNFDVNLTVYHDDGTVAITHGGIEMGQGVNTKAVQVCAYLLGISIEKVQIKGNNTFIAPNGFISGGSITSQNVAIGVQRCCNELLRRLQPIRSQMTNPTWEALIKRAFEADVDLQVHGYVGQSDVQNYNIYGATLAEVELDILTGESEVRRVDLLEDVGQSVSPEIDIGQVEGAFIMGLGYWTSEQLVYNPNTGELLTDRTWNYHVPQARDIPQDFRIYFRKKSYSNDTIFGAKATGEPPICMAIAVPFAVREAIAAARLESGIPTTQWFTIGIDGPYSLENILMSTKTKIEDFKFY